MPRGESRGATCVRMCRLRRGEGGCARVRHATCTCRLSARNFCARALSTVSQRGGAIYLTRGDGEIPIVSVTVIRSTFRGTSAKRGGAICVYDGELTIRDSTFEQSSTTQDGGAVYVRNSNANITRTSFRDAHADSGGLLYLRNSNVTIGDSNHLHAGSERGVT